MRGFVYQANGLMAVQQDGVYWVHQDPITKSKRVTDILGNVVSALELDPWGGETNRSWNTAFQPRTFNTYNRDSNGSDEAMFRRYNRWHSRFDQPDPHSGSFDLSDPQSFNRYTYVKNDPINFNDPTGPYAACIHEAMTKYLAKISGRFTAAQGAVLAHFTGDGKGGADSPEYAATSGGNIWDTWVNGSSPTFDIHFASEQKLAEYKASFRNDIRTGNYQHAGFGIHAIEDAHGAHVGYGPYFGHASNWKVDWIINDDKFWRAANEVYQLLSGNNHAHLTDRQMRNLLNAIVQGCGKNPNLEIKGHTPGRGHGSGGGGGTVGGGGGGGGGDFGGYPSWWYSLWAFVDWVNSIPVGNGHGKLVGIKEIGPAEE